MAIIDLTPESVAAIPGKVGAHGRALFEVVEEFNASVQALKVLEARGGSPAATKASLVQSLIALLSTIEAAHADFDGLAQGGSFRFANMAELKRDLADRARRYGGALPGLGA